MTATEWASNMYPYWILGVGVICAVLFTKERGLLRINWKAIIDWGKLLILAVSIRFVLYKIFPHFFIFENMGETSTVPWITVFTVFWEDAAHALPLLLLRKLIGDGKKASLLFIVFMCLSMLDFSQGHLYQGPVVAAMAGIYVPLSLFIGERLGFGTMMIGHIMFDISSILFVRCLMGA
jgi:hypothetical protein